MFRPPPPPTPLIKVTYTSIPSNISRSVVAFCLLPPPRRHGPAPVSSVLQSPKDTPLEFFQDSGRPLSARMSDKPGGAFSGLRPRSFSRVKGPMRSRVSSIEEEDIMSARGQQPLVGQKSYSGAGAGGFGRSGSSIGASDRPLSSRRISGSRSRERRIPGSRSREGGGAGGVGNSSSGEREMDERPRSTSSSSGRKDISNGARGMGSPLPSSAPGQDGATRSLLKSQHNSIGTALHAIDTSGSAINSGRGAGGSAAHASAGGTSAAAVGGGVATTALPQRRASASGPVGRSNGGHKSGFDSSPPQGEAGGGGGTMLPRRTSTSNLPSMTGGGGGAGGIFDSVTTVGTPGSVGDASKTPIGRGLARAATARAPERGGGFGMRGR